MLFAGQIATAFLAALSTASASAISERTPSALGLPFCTNGRYIVSSNGQNVLYKGANWPGHLEAMIPEGLQYQSIDKIVSQLKNVGLNSVRLTYATEMVDDIYSNGGKDTTLQQTLVTALGQTNGTAILAKIVKNNPSLNANTTRLQVFDAVAKGLAKHDIILHLDNQVSKADWCCIPGDGNGWWGERDFNTSNWIRGWSYIAAHGAKNWPTFASVGLRNELRFPLFSTTADPYDWYTWYQRMTTAATAIHTAAPNALIFFGGTESDTVISKVPLNQSLDGTLAMPDAFKSTYFTPSNWTFQDKIVLELHRYDDFFHPTNESCDTWVPNEYKQGFQAVNASDPTTKQTFPVVLTEFGFPQDGSYYQNQYPKCILKLVQQERVGWMQWAWGGSYYIRQGTQDYDEGWGLLNHDWSALRSSASVQNNLKPLIQAVS